MFQPSSFLRKVRQLHVAGVAPIRSGLPKCTEWQWKLLKVRTSYVSYSVTPPSGARRFTLFVFFQVNNAIGFRCPCVTVHEANE